MAGRRKAERDSGDPDLNEPYLSSWYEAKSIYLQVCDLVAKATFLIDNEVLNTPIVLRRPLE